MYNKSNIQLFDIHSLTYRMKHHMALDEAEKFNAELFKQYYGNENNNSVLNYEFETDELMEYCLLHKEDTGLPMECYADDGGSWKHHQHGLWFLMKNGYQDTLNVIPFTVNDNPSIVGVHKLNVSQDDVNKVVTFITRNKERLIALGNDDIDNIEFIDSIDAFQYRMAENKERIDEMSKIRASRTGLPTDIWVDEDKLYLKGGHAQRMISNNLQSHKIQ